MSLANLRDHANRLNVLPIASLVLDDPRFAIWTASGSPNIHHYGRGGLLRHTTEVVNLCLLNRSAFVGLGHQIDERALYLAALYHDASKLDDYAWQPVETIHPAHDATPGTWIKTPFHKLIHHVAGSAIRFARAVDQTQTCQDIEQEVTHAILSHHGLPEWGSAVRPRTRIAHILHLCDNMSACLGHVDTIDLPRPGGHS